MRANVRSEFADSTGGCNTLKTAQAAGVLQMKYITRIYYSEGQKALMWERWQRGDSLQQIAQLFDRSHSSVEGILARNGGIRPAQRHRSSLALTLAERGWLKRTYPGDEDYQVSHETIYRSLFIQARGALKKELLEHLRCTRAMRRSRHHTQKTEDHGKIHDTVPISERPAAVEDRAVPGHWEGGLLCGSASSQIATLVERQTRYVMLVKITNKDTGQSSTR
jgi:hypothetical protein